MPRGAIVNKEYLICQAIAEANWAYRETEVPVCTVDPQGSCGGECASEAEVTFADSGLLAYLQNRGQIGAVSGVFSFTTPADSNMMSRQMLDPDGDLVLGLTRGKITPGKKYKDLSRRNL